MVSQSHFQGRCQISWSAELGQLRTVLVVSRVEGRSGEENGLLASGRGRKVPIILGAVVRGEEVPAQRWRSCSGVGVELSWESSTLDSWPPIEEWGSM